MQRYRERDVSIDFSVSGNYSPRQCVVCGDAEVLKRSVIARSVDDHRNECRVVTLKRGELASGSSARHKCGPRVRAHFGRFVPYGAKGVQNHDSRDGAWTIPLLSSPDAAVLD